MIGRWRRRVATVVRGNDEEIVRSHGCNELGKSAIEGLECACVPFDVVSMAVEHVEIDEVAEDEPGPRAVHCPDRPVDEVHVPRPGNLLGDATMEEDRRYLADPDNGETERLKPIEQRFGRRIDSVIVSARRSHVGARRSGKRASDDAANFVRSAQLLAGDLTYPVQLGDRNDVLVRRNHVGLLAEDIDPRTGELWGNFPQTYSQVGLVLSATRLSRSWEEGLWRAS